MSKIRNARGRNVERDGESGYTRVMGNERLGQLLSRVQATSISNGNELETLIADRCENIIDDIDQFIDDVTNSRTPDGVFLCLKSILKKTRLYAREISKIEPDMLIFIVSNRRICKVIELKDGDTFDTKKVKGEKRNLEQFTQRFGVRIPFVIEYYICSFNQNNKEAIRIGMKNEFALENILTGRELCEILNIDYDEIVDVRREDMEDNFNYFIEELLNIPEVAEAIRDRLEE